MKNLACLALLTLLLTGCLETTTPMPTPSSAPVPLPAVTSVFPATWTPVRPVAATGTPVVATGASVGTGTPNAPLPPTLTRPAPTATPSTPRATSPSSRTLARPAWTQPAVPTPMPRPAAVISPANANRVTQLGRLGKGALAQIVYSPDGRLLAAATSIGVYLYDAKTLAQARFIGESAPVANLMFSPNGATLLGSLEMTGLLAADTPNVRVWEMATGNPVTGLAAHDQSKTNVVFSPDGNKLAFTARDGSVQVTSLEDQHTLYTFKLQGGMRCMAFSPDGALLAIGTGRNTIEFQNVATGQLFKTMPVSAQSLAFSPNGQLLVTQSPEHKVQIWETATGRERSALPGIYTQVNNLVFSPDGKWLAGVLPANIVKLWDTLTARSVYTLTGSFAGIHTLAFSPDGTTLAAGSRDGVIQTWDVGSGRELNKVAGHIPGVVDIAFAPDGNTLASAETPYGPARIWQVNTGEEVNAFSSVTRAPNGMGTLWCVAYSPDGKYLALGSGEPATLEIQISGESPLLPHDNVILIDTATGSRTRILTGTINGVLSMAFSPDAKLLVGTPTLGPLSLWEVNTGRKINLAMTAGVDSVKSLAFSPDGKILALGAEDGTLKLLDTATWRELRSTSKLANWAWDVAFSPDGRTIASGDAAGIIVLWDTANGQALRAARPQDGIHISSVAFSPDGKLLASAGYTLLGNHIVTLWEASTGRELTTLYGHTKSTATVTFSPDGKLLASSSMDGTVRLWGVQ